MSRPLVIALFGPVFCGKSRLVRESVDILRAFGVTTGGFIQEGVFDGGGNKTGYELVGLSSGLCRMMAWKNEDGPGWRFDEAAFELARTEVREGADLIVIDEIGWLELEGKGHAAALRSALEVSRVVLVVVREGLLDEVEAMLSPGANVLRHRFSPGGEDDLVEIVREAVASAG